MGSEGPSGVTIHVTGFKKFHGVAENPTETIVSNLEEYMQKKGLPKGLVLGSCTILETAGQGALAQLYKILESAVAGPDNESPNNGQIIWVSFLPCLFPVLYIKNHAYSFCLSPRLIWLIMGSLHMHVFVF